MAAIGTFSQYQPLSLTALELPREERPLQLVQTGGSSKEIEELDREASDARKWACVSLAVSMACLVLMLGPVVAYAGGPRSGLKVTVESACWCDHGAAATEGACLENPGHTCASCNEGYELTDHRCSRGLDARRLTQHDEVSGDRVRTGDGNTQTETIGNVGNVDTQTAAQTKSLAVTRPLFHTFSWYFTSAERVRLLLSILLATIIGGIPAQILKNDPSPDFKDKASVVALHLILAFGVSLLCGLVSMKLPLQVLGQGWDSPAVAFSAFLLLPLFSVAGKYILIFGTYASCAGMMIVVADPGPFQFSRNWAASWRPWMGFEEFVNTTVGWFLGWILAFGVCFGLSFIPNLGFFFLGWQRATSLAVLLATLLSLLFLIIFGATNRNPDENKMMIASIVAVIFFFAVDGLLIWASLEVSHGAHASKIAVKCLQSFAWYYQSEANATELAELIVVVSSLMGIVGLLYAVKERWLRLPTSWLPTWIEKKVEAFQDFSEKWAFEPPVVIWIIVCNLFAIGRVGWVAYVFIGLAFVSVVFAFWWPVSVFLDFTGRDQKYMAAKFASMPLYIMITGAMRYWMPLSLMPEEAQWIVPLAISTACFQLPLGMFTFFFPWVMLPAYAYYSQSANCIDGIDWEVHLFFIIILILHSCAWGSVIGKDPGSFEFSWESVKTRVMKGKMCFMFFLNYFDFYTDVCFIVLTVSCESIYGFYSFATFLVGVVLCQLIVGAIYNANSTASNMAIIHLLQYPKEVGKEIWDLDEKSVAWDAFVQAVVRSLFEDLPQTYIQYQFTMHVKRNPLIVFSIAISLVSTVSSTTLALFDYCRVKNG